MSPIPIELLPLVSTTSIMLVLGAVALFIIVLLFVPRHRRQSLLITSVEVPRQKEPLKHSELPLIPRAEADAVPQWAVLDFQTTGLCTERGLEDLIVEATWLALDASFRLISQKTLRVRQSYSGSAEARAVHHVTEQQLEECGVCEEELVEQLFADLGRGTTLVMHNAEFDLAILRGTLARVDPSKLLELERYPSFCTMTYLPAEYYPSLATLTASITPYTMADFRSLFPISYRNAYFTRHCLMALLDRYPSL